MATTLGKYVPYGAEFPAANFPQLGQDVTGRHPFLGFDTATSETCYWTDICSQGFTGTITAVIHYRMASATSGGVAFDVAIEAITTGDALDTDAGVSFDTVNAGNDGTVPGTAGYVETLTITLSNLDSMAAGDMFRLSLARDVADAADTATGDCQVLAVELQTSA